MILGSSGPSIHHLAATALDAHSQTYGHADCRLMQSVLVHRASVLRPGSCIALSALRRPGPCVGRTASTTMAHAKRVLVPVANGSEEIEAVTIIDTLRRAGANVVVASVHDHKDLVMSRKVKLTADTLLSDSLNDSYDAIALPGGLPGAEHLRDSGALVDLIKQQKSSGKLIAAICAAPVYVLHSHGLLDGLRATAHPSVSDKLEDQSCVQDRVVVDGKLVTSRGPGTALEFALEVVRQLYGDAKAKEVAGPMLALWT